jgi:hypothetical protein
MLGEHNDACVAVMALRELSDNSASGAVWSAGVLGGLQLARAADCRAQFPAVLKSALAKKNWTWIP